MAIRGLCRPTNIKKILQRELFSDIQMLLLPQQSSRIGRCLVHLDPWQVLTDGKERAHVETWWGVLLLFL